MRMRWQRLSPLPGVAHVPSSLHACMTLLGNTCAQAPTMDAKHVCNIGPLHEQGLAARPVEPHLARVSAGPLGPCPAGPPASTLGNPSWHRTATVMPYGHTHVLTALASQVQRSQVPPGAWARRRGGLGPSPTAALPLCVAASTVKAVCWINGAKTEACVASYLSEMCSWNIQATPAAHMYTQRHLRAHSDVCCMAGILAAI